MCCLDHVQLHPYFPGRKDNISIKRGKQGLHYYKKNYTILAILKMFPNLPYYAGTE